MKTYKVLLIISWLALGISAFFAVFSFAAEQRQQQDNCVVFMALCALMPSLGTLLCANIEHINHIGVVPQKNPEKFYNEERTYIASFFLILTLLFFALTLASIFIPNFTLHHK